MAKKKEEALPFAEEEKPVKKAKAEKTYTLDVLSKRTQMVLGVSSVTFAGATAGLDKTKSYTVGEMKKIIADWSKKGVK